jgi:hypothetical protein
MMLLLWNLLFPPMAFTTRRHATHFATIGAHSAGIAVHGAQRLIGRRIQWSGGHIKKYDGKRADDHGPCIEGVLPIGWEDFGRSISSTTALWYLAHILAGRRLIPFCCHYYVLI